MVLAFLFAPVLTIAATLLSVAVGGVLGVASVVGLVLDRPGRAMARRTLSPPVEAPAPTTPERRLVG